MVTVSEVVEKAEEVWSLTEPRELCPRCRRAWKSICITYCQACEKEINLKVFGLPTSKTLVVGRKP